MKGRPKSVRKISCIPLVEGFVPYGRHASQDREKIVLTYEEYEAFRLNDYEQLIQCEAAAVMGISRPTFTRIYMSARQKIAKALVEARGIEIKGGNVELDSGWHLCSEEVEWMEHPGRRCCRFRQEEDSPK